MEMFYEPGRSHALEAEGIYFFFTSMITYLLLIFTFQTTFDDGERIIISIKNKSVQLQL